MAYFADQYVADIKAATNYSELYKAIRPSFDNNAFTVIANEIHAKIQELPIDGGAAQLMVDLALNTIQNDTRGSTSLALLKSISNQISASPEALNFGDYTNEEIGKMPIEYNVNGDMLLLALICSDNKTFVTKLSEECRICIWRKLYRILEINEAGLMPDQMVFDETNEKILDREALDVINGKPIEDPNTNQFFLALHNLVNHGEEYSFLYLWVSAHLYNSFDNAVDTEVNGLIHELPFADARYVFTSMIVLIRQLNDAIKESNDIERWTGKFLIELMKLGREASLESEGVNTNLIGCYLQIALELTQKYYAISPTTMDIVYKISHLYQDREESSNPDQTLTFVNDKIISSNMSSLRKFLHLDKEYLEFCEIHNLSPMVNNSIVYYLYTGIYNGTIDLPSGENIDTATEANNNGPSPKKTSVQYSREMEYGEEEEEKEKDTEDEEDPPEDTDDDIEYEVQAKQSKKGYSRLSKAQSKADRAIYKGFKKYKNNEQKVDSQLTKMVNDMKTLYKENSIEEIVEGKKFTPIGILKHALGTAACFAFGPIKGIILLVTKIGLDKRRTRRERQKLLIDLQAEIDMLDEKIEDARSDGNRQAKYALMRTRGELQRAYEKIKYSVSAGSDDLKQASDYLKGMKRR